MKFLIIVLLPHPLQEYRDYVILNKKFKFNFIYNDLLTDINWLSSKELKDNLGNEKPLTDIIATLNIVRSAGRVAVVGYCWGGTLAWLSACHVDGFNAAISYYGEGIGQLLSIEPRCPSIFQFGEQDHAIPVAEVNSLRQAHPECPIYLYPANHGFNCEQRDSFHSTSSAIAFERTIQHLDKYI